MEEPAEGPAPKAIAHLRFARGSPHKVSPPALAILMLHPAAAAEHGIGQEAHILVRPSL